MQFVLSSKKTDIYVLVDGKRSTKLPSHLRGHLAPLMSNGYATLEFKSSGAGYINVEVAGTKFARTLPPAVHELENAWEWAD